VERAILQRMWIALAAIAAFLAGLGIARIARLRMWHGAAAAAHELAVVMAPGGDELPLEVLRAHESFQSGIDRLRRLRLDELTRLLGSEHGAFQCLVLAVLREKCPGAVLVRDLLANLNHPARCARLLTLQLLEETAKEPLIPAVIEKLGQPWDEPGSWPLLGPFFARRAGVEPIDPALPLWRQLPAALAGHYADAMEGTGEPALAPLIGALRAPRGGRLEPASIGSFARPVTASSDGEALEHPALLRHVAALRCVLTDAARRSVVLVGEDGVGKSSILQRLASELSAAGWTVFESSGRDMIAGQFFVGALEQRISELLREIGGRRHVLWIVPDLQDLFWAGRTAFAPKGVLDQLLPEIASGRLLLAAEAEPLGWERLLQERPQLRAAFHVERIAPADEATTLELARRWLDRMRLPDGSPRLDEAGLAEAWQLVQHHLDGVAPPGNLIGFLRGAASAPESQGQSRAWSREDLLAGISRATGLPFAMLDERERLDLAQARSYFERAVIGQPEAVGAIVDRLALIKAGLQDPARPLGVFLFTGPTGTGKTEICRTLAAYLFGSADRLIRLDMSEFVSEESLGLLLGDQDPASGRVALVDRIRKQPFAVVLLDEFEKSHPRVWDLFLQVFDAGRLTDRRGRAADFRHAILVMTANVGAESAQGGLSFGAPAAPRGEGAERSLRQTFRPEFLNRIDRIVSFRPLGREVMRRVLRKELALTLQRRGLRHRRWAVEWEESAIEFLLERGFTTEHGARPLRRAVEQHLLAPLAAVIVEHRAPEGDQFLLVRAERDRLAVEFIDPDAPGAAEAEPAVAPALNGIARAGTGARAELDRLAAELEGLAALLADPAWHERRGELLAATGAPDFWTSGRRFQQLGELEVRDRFTHMLRSAQRLLRRLRGDDGAPRAHAAPEPVRRLARSLRLLRHVAGVLDRGEFRDAFVQVEALHDARVPAREVDRCADRLVAMYEAWAAASGIDCRRLEQQGAPGPQRTLFGCAGNSAFDLLAGEEGLHVFERDGRDGIERLRIRVTVAEQPSGLLPEDHAAARQLARNAIAARGSTAQVVRRYRESPSQVTDARGWSTTELDAVLAGGFDLFP
jgi:ATP-dependent Clp protease ATP-binding subunit ClpC